MSKNKKNITNFLLKIFKFYNLKNLYTLHGQVFVMVNLVIAPTPFKPKKSPSRKIEAKSPFSTNRKLSLPTGRVFQVKKSDKPLTQFDEFKTADVSWKVSFCICTFVVLYDNYIQ